MTENETYLEIFDRNIHRVGSFLELFLVGAIMLVLLFMPGLYLIYGMIPSFSLPYLKATGLFISIGFIPMGVTVTFVLLHMATYSEWRVQRAGV
jgi:hypothetical protein